MDCPYLKNMKDGSWVRYNTYICTQTGQKIEYGSAQYENTCACSDHDECPIYKKA